MNKFHSSSRLAAVMKSKVLYTEKDRFGKLEKIEIKPSSKKDQKYRPPKIKKIKYEH